MTAPFECEVRFLIDDIGAFQARLSALGARIIQEYAFTDHYYRPAGGAWDPLERGLRIREHHRPAQPAEVLLTWTELRGADGLRFKRSRLPEGKARLYHGAPDDCRTVVGGLGFELWLTVRKEAGIMYAIPHLGELVIEQVGGVGWMCEVEVEGRNPETAAQAIRDKLAALGTSVEAAIPEPLAAYVARRTRTGRRIYFCGSIRGGRRLQPFYARIVAFLQDHGYEVLTAHVADPNVLARETRDGMRSSDIYTRDLQWLAACDVVIAEVSVPSLGVGVEIATAQHLGKPILCLCRDDVALSAMIAGNDALRVVRYREEDEVFGILDRELRD